ncbi:MAG: [protein-PII] uridylyltransferase [Actinomycetales bacterium]|nr:MAG: [protein-PII] uridylyltransferase [Actinomycetales bacterium]
MEEPAQDRADRAHEADRLLRRLFASAAPTSGDPRAGEGLALVAVGGYGRSELSPFSDLDVVLLHDSGIPAERVQEVAEAIWYPLWDLKVDLDHSVRDAAQMRETAQQDHRAAMGMLDARTVAGDSGLVLALRSHVLADWRRDAREERVERFGWLAHTAVPDLKESGGGLRDGVVLRALVATWLVDVPQAESEHLRSELLDVRDALHAVVGRRNDRLGPELMVDVAERLGQDPEQLDLHVRNVGRRMAHLSALTWRRIEDVIDPALKRRAGTHNARVQQVDQGVGRLDDEVVLTPDASPGKDPVLGLRAASHAAVAGLPLGSSTAARLARDLAPLPEPWPEEARRRLVDLLTAGPGLVPVWDELDYAGVVDRWLPEWSAIRLRGSSSPVHRFTVDRHSVETCVAATALRRDVDRPDLLAVAALLHDIGKGRPGDHSVVGEPVALEIARRWGFSEKESRTISRLVRWHLLLPTVATRRDIEDPSTAANVAEIVETAGFLDLLAALTEADARSTAPSAWSSWRSGLVHGLIEKTRDVLDDTVADANPDTYVGWPEHVPLPRAGVLGPEDLEVTVEEHHGGSLLTVVTADRPGITAQIAGGLALQGLAVRSVRLVTAGDAAASLWEVSRPDVDPAVLRERLRPVIAGEVDLPTRMRLKPVEGATSRVRIVPQSQQTATLLEVRAQDRRGLVWTVSNAIAELGYSIRSAHLSTYGDEARDVFYVVDADGDALDEASAARVRVAVDAALV